MTNPDVMEILRRRQMQQALGQGAVPDDQPQLPPTSLNAPPIVPSYPPSSVAPPPQKTALQNYQDYLGQEPKLSDYKPSLGRKIFGSIMGGLAGLRDPKVGIETGHAIAYAPFEKKESAFQQILGQKKAASDAEGEETKRSEIVSRRGAEESRSGAERARQRREETETRALEPGTPESTEKEKQLHIQHDKTTPELNVPLYDLELQDDTKVEGATLQVSPDGSRLTYKGPNGQIINSTAVKKAQKAAAERAPGTVANPLEAELDAFKRDNSGRSPNAEETTEIVRKIAEAQGLLGERAASTDLKKAQTKLTTKRTEGASPQEIDQARQFQATHPESYGAYLKQFSDIKRRDLMSQVPPVALPQGADQVAATTAHTTLNHARTLRELVEDPFIKNNMGPILGRIQSAEGAVGGNPVGASPEDAEKEQKFLSFLTQNMAWEARNLGGNRPAWQLIQRIQKTAPKAGETYERFLGALDAEEQSAQNRLEAILGITPETTKPKKQDGPQVRGIKEVE